MNNNKQLEETRIYFNSLPIEDRISFISNMSPPAFRYFKYFTDCMFWDKQLIPDGDWKYYIMLGGRGSSKSFSIAHDIKKRLMRGDSGLMAVSPSYSDMNDVMVPMILEQFPDDYQATYNGQKKIITAPNGNTISMKSAEQGIIKGRNVTTCYIDELSECWATSDLDKQLNYFRILDGNIRKGNAQLIISSNPETTPIFRHLYDMHLQTPDIVQLIHSSIHDNPYLDPHKKAIYVNQWKGTRYEKMQLLGQLDWSADGALWTQGLIDKTRVRSPAPGAGLKEHIIFLSKNNYNPLSFFIRFIIAVDPAMSVSEKSDETGIIIGGLGRDNHVYILEDLSGKWSPDDTGEIIQQAMQRYPNIDLAVETNQGGMYVIDLLKTKLPMLNPNKIKNVKVRQSKMTRAQHIVVLWDQLTAHIVGNMQKLEQQMIYYNGDSNQKSPDRFDAMVMATHELVFGDYSQNHINNLPRF